MSTIVDVDFSRILPPNAPAPRVAVADITALNSNGEEDELVREGLVINLRKTHVVEDLQPGNYLVRLRVPTGQLLSKRVLVVQLNGKSAMEFVPARAKPRFDDSYSDDEELRIEVGSSAPTLASRKNAQSSDSADRGRWTAKLMEAADATLNYLPGLPVLEVVKPNQDYMGVARLQATPRSDVVLSEHRDKHQLSSYLVGDIAAVQAAKLYGDSREMRAQWKKPLRKDSIIGKASEEGQGARFFALSYRATDNAFSPLQVACMPGRWFTQDQGLAKVEAAYFPRRVAGRTRRSIRLEVDDPDFGGLIEFLQQGDLSGAVQVVDRSLEKLYYKWNNPYAAALAGYVLVSAGLPSTVGWENWEQWILNLASQFTGLPDGAILYTTLVLQGPPGIEGRLDFSDAKAAGFRRVVDAALEAVRRGPPLYRYGLKLMSTNLDILVHEGGLNRTVREEVLAAQSYIRELSLRVDPGQPFCVFDVAQ
jgi:hypothetical protein